MYRHLSKRRAGYLQFILLDLLCLNIGFYVAYMLRINEGNPYANDLYWHMIVMMCILDIVVVTVMSTNIRSGYLTGCCKEDRFGLFVPSSLKKELNDYARKNGIIHGPIFLTRNGTPVNRNNILAEMGKLSREARVAPEKCNPRSLAKMYVSTREEIDNQMAIAAEREYIRILESEQKVCGWDC